MSMRTNDRDATITTTSKKALRLEVQADTKAGEVGAVAQAARGDTSRFDGRPGRDLLVEGWTEDSCVFAYQAYGR